jgi:hypothetical protein
VKITKFINIAAVLVFSQIILSGCAPTVREKQSAEFDALKKQCVAMWRESKYDPIRKMVPWNMPSQAIPEMNQVRIPSKDESQIISEMVSIFAACELKGARLVYQMHPSAGAASFVGRARNEAIIIEQLKDGKLTYLDANKYRYKIINNQFTVIQADDLNRAAQFQRQQQQQHQDFLKNQERLLNDQLRNTPRTTNTQCQPDGLGGMRCTSSTN